jgi:hypothetical protein
MGARYAPLRGSVSPAREVAAVAVGLLACVAESARFVLTSRVVAEVTRLRAEVAVEEGTIRPLHNPYASSRRCGDFPDPGGVQGHSLLGTSVRSTSDDRCLSWRGRRGSTLLNKN